MSGRWALRDGQGRRLKTGRRDVPGGRPAIPTRTKWRPPESEPVENAEGDQTLGEAPRGAQIEPLGRAMAIPDPRPPMDESENE